MSAGYRACTVGNRPKLIAVWDPSASLTNKKSGHVSVTVTLSQKVWVVCDGTSQKIR